MQPLTIPLNRPEAAGPTTSPSCCGRCFDVVFATAALLVLWPALLAIALAVVLFDGRPVFFRQERVGWRGRPFRIWKFRTMRSAAPGEADLLITAAGDPRVTKIGRWLRELKLDELPQFLNVLVGEMSIIGPRPEVPRYVDLQREAWQTVLALRPGITDAATLVYLDEGRTLAACPDPETYYRETILPRKLALNLKYARLRSRQTDLRLIVLTLRRILRLGPRDDAWIRDLLPVE